MLQVLHCFSLEGVPGSADGVEASAFCSHSAVLPTPEHVSHYVVTVHFLCLQLDCEPQEGRDGVWLWWFSTVPSCLPQCLVHRGSLQSVCRMNKSMNECLHKFTFLKAWRLEQTAPPAPHSPRPRPFLAGSVQNAFGGSG